jgi:23S rRNA (adenine2030-N6)-methyltransferase
LNYRHAFHAGNHADVLKHVALLACLMRLAQKPAPFAVLDAFAGPGLYDLTGDEATRSPEWQSGVAKLWDWQRAPLALQPYRAALKALNPDGRLRHYPGSPKLIRQGFREEDNLIACELHRDDAQTLKRNFRGDAQTQIHVRDGFEATPALLPFTQRRGLVLIDPPYEQDGELARAAEALREGVRKFSTGVFVWWRPEKPGGAAERHDADLSQLLRRPMLRATLAVAAPEREGKLNASSVAIINPPYGVQESLRAALPALTERLAIGEGAAWKLTEV